MKNRLRITDDDRWQSVLARDADADGQFVFAVQTTGIFCRPSCRAKHALRKMSAFSLMLSRRRLPGFAPVSAASRIKTARSSIGWTKLPAPASCWSKSHLLRWTSWHNRWQ